MAKKKSHGGPRKGSGRKPVDDLAVPITFYVKQSVLDKVGKEAAKMIAIKAVNKEAKKK